MGTTTLVEGLSPRGAGSWGEKEEAPLPSSVVGLRPGDEVLPASLQRHRLVHKGPQREPGEILRPGAWSSEQTLAHLALTTRLWPLGEPRGVRKGIGLGQGCRKCSKDGSVWVLSGRGLWQGFVSRGAAAAGGFMHLGFRMQSRARCISSSSRLLLSPPLTLLSSQSTPTLPLRLHHKDLITGPLSLQTVSSKGSGSPRPWARPGCGGSCW